MDATQLKQALGFSVSAIATEHFFSAGMSSPWSVAKFATTEQDAKQVWSLFWSGTAASVAFAAIVGLMMQDKWTFVLCLLGAASVAGFMWWEYDKALKGTL